MKISLQALIRQILSTPDSPDDVEQLDQFRGTAEFSFREPLIPAPNIVKRTSSDVI